MSYDRLVKGWGALLSALPFIFTHAFSGQLRADEICNSTHNIRYSSKISLESSWHYNLYEYATDLSGSGYIRRFFKKETSFYAETSTVWQLMIFEPDGSCSCVGEKLIEGYWFRGESSGTYYIKNNVIYATWDGDVRESYRLSQNGASFKHYNLIFRKK